MLGRNRNVDLKRVNVAINGKELLASATLRLHEGRHYGLVGRNGVGKSTLLSRMARSMIDGTRWEGGRVVSRLPGLPDDSPREAGSDRERCECAGLRDYQR